MLKNFIIIVQLTHPVNVKEFHCPVNARANPMTGHHATPHISNKSYKKKL